MFDIPQSFPVLLSLRPITKCPHDIIQSLHGEFKARPAIKLFFMDARKKIVVGTILWLWDRYPSLWPEF